MTRFASGLRINARASFGPWFSAIAAPTSSTGGGFGRRFYGDAPPLAVRPTGRARAMLQRWRQRAHQRRQLLQMDEHLLRDIGVTRAEALDEAVKPFWRG